MQTDTSSVLSPEQTLALVLDLCRSALHSSELDIGSDLFEAGIDSLTATKVVADLRHELGVDVGLRELFENPVIEDFAKVVCQSPAIA